MRQCVSAPIVRLLSLIVLEISESRTGARAQHTVLKSQVAHTGRFNLLSRKESERWVGEKISKGDRVGRASGIPLSLR